MEEVVNTVVGHTHQVLHVCFNLDGTRIASCSRDAVQVWDVATREGLFTFGDFKRDECSSHRDDGDRMSSVTFSPDGAFILTGSAYGKVKLWDGSTGSLNFTFEGHSRNGNSVCFSPDGARIASSGYTVCVSDLLSKSLIITLDGHGDTVYSVCFNFDGSKIASGSMDRKVRIWETATWTLTTTFETHRYFQTDCLLALFFCPKKDDLIVSASEDGDVCLWDSATGSCTKPSCLRGLGSDADSICFSPDGAHMLSGSKDGSISVWDAVTWTHVATLEGHTGGVQSVCVSPDGTLIASGSDDHTVRIWDAATNAPTSVV